MKSLISNLFVALAVLFFIAYGIFLFVMGYLGIEEYLGTGWAVIAVIAAFLLRFTLPLTIGSIYGVMVFFNLNVGLSILIVIPTLVFIVPSFFVMLFAGIMAVFQPNKYKKDTQVIDVEIVS